MPSAPGPCRFGQYAPFLRRTLDSVGATDVLVVSPSSSSGYDELGEDTLDMQRAAWRGLIAADILRKALLRLRPYEATAGTTESAYEEAIASTCAVLEQPHRSASATMARLRGVMRDAGVQFASIPRTSEERLLIGIVGEIFCRLNVFANEEVILKLEEQGAETWLADIGEWVYYTNLEQRRKWIPESGGRYSRRMVAAWVKDVIQRRDEHALVAPFLPLFEEREEPDRISRLTDLAEPYLPAEGVYGEMVMNTGKALYLAGKGCDGILDISPFSCMNGIVSEAVYPKISRDHGGIPMRTFYFDQTQLHLYRDIGIFLELARTYRKRKRNAENRTDSAFRGGAPAR
jgi:predicted nucleotide-binding protein (sugar kinase/HSP70/actin superfamily)